MSAPILIVCLFPLILVSCASTKKQTNHNFSFSTMKDDATQDKGKSVEKTANFSEVDAKRKEAILMDVPIPLYNSRIPVVSDDAYGNQIVLGYQSSIAPCDLVTLYREQMERNGWNLAQSFTGSESLLHFEKPARACMVSIRPHKKFFGQEGSELIIYVEDNSLVW